MIEITFLPQALTSPLFVVVTDSLLPVRHEALKVGALIGRCEHQVKMIRHEAVRMNCKPECPRALPNCDQCQPDGVGILESGVSKVGADRNGIVPPDKRQKTKRSEDQNSSDF
jgi:hypothetical protein